jgi:hypothetical protein
MSHVLSLRHITRSNHKRSPARVSHDVVPFGDQLILTHLNGGDVRITFAVGAQDQKGEFV